MSLFDSLPNDNMFRVVEFNTLSIGPGHGGTFTPEEIVVPSPIGITRFTGVTGNTGGTGLTGATGKTGAGVTGFTIDQDGNLGFTAIDPDGNESTVNLGLVKGAKGDAGGLDAFDTTLWLHLGAIPNALETAAAADGYHYYTPETSTNEPMVDGGKYFFAFSARSSGLGV